MAIAVTGGHVGRALDFYNTVGKYFIVGGTTPWADETAPTAPTPADFKLSDVVGLKKVDEVNMVIPAESGTIQYRNQNWKIVPVRVSTVTASDIVIAGSSTITVASVSGLTVGAKLRINNLYEGIIVSMIGLSVTLDTAAPANIPIGSTVLGGAEVEGAKYVYIKCYLNYDEFPLVTYRQIGVCTGVTPNTIDVLKSSAYSISNTNEYTSLGRLEILDNRVPSTRDIDQREELSLIIEF